MRAQRSNPDRLRGGILDCFAALAMTALMQLCPKRDLVPPDAAQRPFDGARQSRDPCCRDA
ncbi:hypothetical protein XH91_13505 [Bradyrhizobium guangzhouense]|uniref:Uncharacterized protein n=1 Tax=Bradyrhizobium guangzhouense TaxID=1325095 RepID=A0AAE5X070_9BRAD|nr:hypothetical protein XH91_13505 [Bradyrhizobium guangzhouense]